MSDRIKNILIGLFIVAAIGSTIWTILFLEPSIGDGKKTVHVQFTDISGVNIGTRVNLAGRSVGEVVAIQVTEKARNQRIDSLNRVYYYQLTLKVDSTVDIYSSDEVAVRTTGLLGEKSISIIPKAAKKGQTAKIITNQVIYGNAIDPLQNALVQFSEMSDEIETLVKDVDTWFIANKEDLGNSVRSFGKSMDSANSLMADAKEKDLVGSIKKTVDELYSDLNMVNDMLQEARDNEAMAKVNTIINNVADASESIKTDGVEIMQNLNIVSQQLADGKGTVGKLLTSDNLYLRVETFMSKANTLMNDINHYGLLFGYDKKWQRQRTRKANEMQALKTPKGFKNYFESEVDTVNTSLARLSILLEKAEAPLEKQRIMSSNAFKGDFATLMREVKGLLDSLQLYNEELMQNTANK